jgi:hypothetical protein
MLHFGLTSQIFFVGEKQPSLFARSMSDEEEEDVHQVEAETGKVDGGVGHEEQDGAQLGDLVERPHEETQA